MTEKTMGRSKIPGCSLELWCSPEDLFIEITNDQGKNISYIFSKGDAFLLGKIFRQHFNLSLEDIMLEESSPKSPLQATLELDKTSETQGPSK